MPTAPSLPTTITAGTTVGHAGHTQTVHAVVNSAYRVTVGTTRTASFTLAASDCGELIPINTASAVAVTLPVLTAGHATQFVRQGAGAVTFTAVGTTIVKATDVSASLRIQGSVATAVYLTSTLVLLSGDLT